MRTVYLNQQFVPESDAKLSIFDRGFLFADAVYEVVSVLDGGLIDFEAHLKRLRRSLGEIHLVLELSDAQLLLMHQELVRLNDLREGMIYMQVSRGSAERDFQFPANPQPTVVAFTQDRPLIANPKAQIGLSVITVADQRWGRCDIKTVSLLAASLAKHEAQSAGADDAWFVTDDAVTEGTSNNAFIVNQQGQIVTRQLGNEILPGITRQAVLAVADELGLSVVQRPIRYDELGDAIEAFSTSASSFVMPVTSINGEPVGDGQPGEITQRLRTRYIEFARLSVRH